MKGSAAGGTIWIATITLVEVRYLVEKGKVPPITETTLWDAVNDSTDPIRTLPLTDAVAAALGQIPRHLVPDMPDRIIAATALAHGLPLVTADRKIRTAHGITTIW